jgi:hypothetical protein
MAQLHATASLPACGRRTARQLAGSASGMPLLRLRHRVAPLAPRASSSSAAAAATSGLQSLRLVRPHAFSRLRC